MPDPLDDTSRATVPVPSGSASKEIEGAEAGEPLIREVGTHEVLLPKEVASAGVRVRPTTVSLPPKVSQMGVRPVGPTSKPVQTTTVALPLTDDQIALGLKQSITNSWRWLAEWCVRRLKQIHMTLKGMGGKVVRVKR